MKNWLAEWGFLVAELLIILSMLVTLLSVQSCNYYHVKAAVADTAHPVFADVKAILDVACARCHGGGLALGGFSSESYEEVIKKVVAGDKSKSPLYTQPESGAMPLGGPALGPDEIKVIGDWIDQGAKKEEDTEPPVIPEPPVDPDPPVIPPPPELTYTKDVKPILDSFCIRCHGISGGVTLTDYDSVLKTLAVGDSVHSPLCDEPKSGRMPLGGPSLLQDHVDTICHWIDDGAKL